MRRQISIYAPRMGRYCDGQRDCVDAILFQFMRPVWGATCPCLRAGCPCSISIYAPRMGRYGVAVTPKTSASGFQFMRPVWGATVAGIAAQCFPGYFNLCAPYGALLGGQLLPLQPLGFQFMRPVWGATRDPTPGRLDISISIYAPRMGRYRWHVIYCLPPRNFNLCAPYGALHRIGYEVACVMTFQFMRPVWGATQIRFNTCFLF